MSLRFNRRTLTAILFAALYVLITAGCDSSSSAPATSGSGVGDLNPKLTPAQKARKQQRDKQ